MTPQGPADKRQPVDFNTEIIGQRIGGVLGKVGMRILDIQDDRQRS